MRLSGRGMREGEVEWERDEARAVRLIVTLWGENLK